MQKVSQNSECKRGGPIFQVWGGEKNFSQNPRGGTKALHTMRIQEKNERNLLLEMIRYDSRTSYSATEDTNLQKDNDNRIYITFL